MLLGYAAMFGIISVSADFVPMFFGKGYEPVIDLLYLMSPLIIIIGISNCLGSHYYTPAGYREKSARYLIIGSIINLICNLIFIPIFEAKGAVVGTIIAEMSISFLYLKNCNGFLTLAQVWKNSYKRIIAGLIMLIFINLIRKILSYSIFYLIIEICSGAIVYFLILVLLRDSLVIELMDNVKLKIIYYVRK